MMDQDRYLNHLNEINPFIDPLHVVELCQLCKCIYILALDNIGWTAYEIAVTSLIKILKDLNRTDLLSVIYESLDNWVTILIRIETYRRNERENHHSSW